MTTKVELEEKSKKVTVPYLGQIALGIPDLSNQKKVALAADAVGQIALSEIVYPGLSEKIGSDVSKEPPAAAAKVRTSAKRKFSPPTLTSLYNLPPSDSSSKKVRAAPDASRELETILEKTKVASDPTEVDTSLLRTVLNTLDPQTAALQSKEIEGEARAVLQDLSQANKKLAQRVDQFPNAAREILKLGLLAEASKTKELEKYTEATETHRKKIGVYLKLSAQLDALPIDQPKHNLDEILKKFTGPEKEEIAQCMKEVFPNGSSDITKEHLAGAKVRVGDLMNDQKTAITNWMTKMTVLTQNLTTILQCIQASNRLDERQHSTFTRNQLTK